MSQWGVGGVSTPYTSSGREQEERGDSNAKRARKRYPTRLPESVSGVTAVWPLRVDNLGPRPSALYCVCVPQPDGLVPAAANKIRAVAAEADTCDLA